MLFWRCDSMCGIAIKFRVFVYKKTELRQKSHLDSYFLLGAIWFHLFFSIVISWITLQKNERIVKRPIGLILRYVYLQHTDFAGRFICIQYLKCLTQREKKLKSLSKYFSYYLKTLLYSHSLNSVSTNANRIGLIK